MPCKRLLAGLFAGALVLTASVAFASLEVLEKAYELKRDQVISLPRSAGGQLSIRTCRKCDAIVLRVNGDTRYYLSPSPIDLPLKDWLAEDASAGDKGKFIYVFYGVNDNIVTRMVLDTGH